MDISNRLFGTTKKARIESALRGLAHSDSETRRVAQNKLIAMGTDSVEPLITFLTYKAPFDSVMDETVAAVIYVLGELRDSRAVEPIIARLPSRRVDVERRAIEALEKIGGLSVEQLVTLLRFPGCMTFACTALSNQKVSQAVPALLEILRKYNDERVLECAASAVVSIGGSTAIWGYVWLLCLPMARLDRKKTEQREAAVRQAGLEAVEPLGAALQSRGGKWVRRTALEMLSGFKNSAAIVPYLVPALKDKEQDIRKGAAELLSEITDRSAIEPLKDALKSEHTRYIAAKALTKFGGDEALLGYAMMMLMDYPRSEHDAQAQEEALRTAGSHALDLLLEAVKIATISGGFGGFQGPAMARLRSFEDPRLEEAIHEYLVHEQQRMSEESRRMQGEIDYDNILSAWERTGGH